MSDKKQHIFYEEEANLENIHKDINSIYNKNKERIEIYKNTRDRGINAYKEVDETEASKCVEKNKELEQIWGEPYFGRMDLVYSGEKLIEKVYIGKRKFIINNEAKIISWAAPIANVFNRGLGSFEVVNNDFKDKKSLCISGKKILKRKIFIKNGKLKDVISEGELNYTKKEEEHIKEKIENSSTHKLNHILETVQEDQNKIIRQPISKSILIQGCAGSGKSSVAYHRVAQLIYNEKLKYDEVLVIAPNKLFMEYTKTITTDLGMEFNVKQMTFLELSKEILGDNLKHINSFSFENNDVELNILKTSMEYKLFLDNFVKYLEEKALIKNDVYLSGYEIISCNKLKYIWENHFKGYKLNSRIGKFKKYIKDKLKAKKSYLLEQINKEYKLDEEILEKYCENKSRLKKHKVLLKKEKLIKMARINVQFDLIVDEYIRSINEIDTLEEYSELLKKPDLIEKLGEDIFTIGELELLMKNKSKLYFNKNENIPIMYLYMKLNDLNLEYRHIVVDEYQDLSILELIIIKKLAKTFTFVGDFNQRIINDRDNMTYEHLKSTFENHSFFDPYILNKSFRNTKHITNFSNEIIKPILESEKYLPIAFNREGSKPILVKVKNDDDRVNYIIDFINNNIIEDSLGIIFKNDEKCREYYKLIINKFKEENIGLITDDSCKLNKKINIITAPLSKGLEFKNVIIADAEVYSGKKDYRNLLYVQCTRALNKLVILYKNKLPKIIGNINKSLYEYKEYDNEKKIKYLRLSILELLSFLSFDNVEKIINNINDYNKLTDIIGNHKDIKKLEDLKKYL